MGDGRATRYGSNLDARSASPDQKQAEHDCVYLKMQLINAMMNFCIKLPTQEVDDQMN